MVGPRHRHGDAGDRFACCQRRRDDVGRELLFNRARCACRVPATRAHRLRPACDVRTTVRLRTILARVGWFAAIGATSGAPRLAAAQGNLSTQGAGYPEGELSTGALASGGGLAEFDALSPINPA